jgi:hypothetical protein
LRSHRRWVSPALAVAMLAAITGMMAVVMPAPLCSDATGCTRLDNKKYNGGICITSANNGCYMCEVSEGGNIKICYEAPDPVDGSSCLDQRDTNWNPWE